MHVARYHRVSTENQSLQRQADATDSYIGRNFDNPDVTTFTDASTGTNTAREEYLDMMEQVKNDIFDVVLIKSISRISRSIRDLSKTVDELHEHDTSLHIIDESLQIKPGAEDPMQKAIWQLLGVFAEFEAEMTRKRIKEGIAARREHEDYHHGPPPLGFRKEDGSLIQTEQFDQVVAVLEMVMKDQISVRSAARELDTSRRTINRAIDERKELYGLTDLEPEGGETTNNNDIQNLEQRIVELENKIDE